MIFIIYNFTNGDTTTTLDVGNFDSVIEVLLFNGHLTLTFMVVSLNPVHGNVSDSLNGLSWCDLGS